MNFLAHREHPPARTQRTLLARVLHVLPTLVIGGAQRTASTLARTPGFESRVAASDEAADAAVGWADVVLVHAWRKTRNSPELNVPSWIEAVDDAAVILFNHDWEGFYAGPADMVVVYSRFAARHWHGPQRPVVVPGGIRLERFTSVARRRSYSSRPTVGRLSTMHVGKINTSTLAYWPRITAAAYLIGGEGSQRADLMAAYADSRFQFVGEVRPSRTHEFLARLDVFLYDTAWHIESFCYVVLEALASGCAVVAARRGAIPELVTAGETGLLFNSAEEAVQLTNSLLGDCHERARLGHAAAASAHRFSDRRMQSTFAAHIHHLLGHSAVCR